MMDVYTLVEGSRWAGRYIMKYSDLITTAMIINREQSNLVINAAIKVGYSQTYPSLTIQKRTASPQWLPLSQGARGNRSYTTAPLKQCRSGYRCIVSSNCSKCSGNRSIDSGHPCAFPLQEKRPAPGEGARSRRSGPLQKRPTPGEADYCIRSS